jgi:hypothetical protein
MNDAYGKKMYMGTMDRRFIVNNEDDCVLGNCI